MIDKHKTGVYIAYPTSDVLKPIYRGYKTMVNHRHTKVGITKDSFTARENGYKVTFDGEVEFVPIAEIAADRLQELERAILIEVSNQYGKVGRAREWFDTDDRKSLINLINRFLEGYR